MAAALALRLCPNALASTYEVKHQATGEIRPVGKFELEQLCDGDINELTAIADSRRGEWIGFVPYKRRYTRPAYR